MITVVVTVDRRGPAPSWHDGCALILLGRLRHPEN